MKPRDWGIVRRFRAPGDRKDLYESDHDPVRMFARVARERKRRELDPTHLAIQECLDNLDEEPQTAEGAVLRERLQGLADVFKIVDLVYDQILKTDEAFEQTLKLFGRRD